MVVNTHRVTTITLSLRAWVDKWGTFVVYIYIYFLKLGYTVHTASTHNVPIESRQKRHTESLLVVIYSIQ